MSCQGGIQQLPGFLDLTTVSVHRHEAEWRCRFVDTCELVPEERFRDASVDACECLRHVRSELHR